ncbi:MAG: hypothetical protein M3Z26_18135 [Bacteroidota bacterium]|nr:hypothetical protein [Bacteroidota bacterium]
MQNLIFFYADVGVPNTTQNSNKPIHRRCCVFRADGFAVFSVGLTYPSD